MSKIGEILKFFQQRIKKIKIIVDGGGVVYIT